jgi:chemosensory pili system protein ChpC
VLPPLRWVLSMTQQVKSSNPTIPCFILPMQDMQLILPNEAVAEVVGWTPPTPVEAVPDWFLGEVEWRGETVPVISYERLNESPSDGRSEKARIVVLNGSGQFDDMDFFAMVIQSIPHMLRVDIENMTEVQDVESVPSVQMVVNSPVGTGIIPNMVHLEKCVHDIYRPS